MATAPSEERRSALGLLRDVVLSLTEMLADSTELVSATLREELERFRVGLARQALAIAALLAGASLLSAGLLIYSSRLLGSWPLALSIFGALYLAIGLGIMKKGEPK